MKFFDEGESITAKEIDALENTIGKPFPEEYRAFLIEHNGGRPEPAIVDIDGASQGASQIQIFLGVTGPVESETLEWSWQVFQERIPERLLPIADDPFGNLFCLSLEGPDRGHVLADLVVRGGYVTAKVTGSSRKPDEVRMQIARLGACWCNGLGSDRCAGYTLI